MIGRNGKGEDDFASNVSWEKFERALRRPPDLGDHITAAYQSWRETGVRPEPMPPWRERQIKALMRDAPEPLWWGAVVRPSAWVLAALALGLACFEWGGYAAAKLFLGVCR